MKKVFQIMLVMFVSLVFLGCGSTHYFKGSATTHELENRIELLEEIKKTVDKVEEKDTDEKKKVHGKILAAAGKIAEEIGNVGDEREGVSYDGNWDSSGDLNNIAEADDKFNKNFKTVGFKSMSVKNTQTNYEYTLLSPPFKNEKLSAKGKKGDKLKAQNIQIGDYIIIYRWKNIKTKQTGKSSIDLSVTEDGGAEIVF